MTAWQSEANCAGLSPSLFFPARGDMHAVREAKAVCRGCTVIARCLEANVHEEDGVWAGTTAPERLQIRKARRRTA